MWKLFSLAPVQRLWLSHLLHTWINFFLTQKCWSHKDKTSPVGFFKGWLRHLHSVVHPSQLITVWKKDCEGCFLRVFVAVSVGCVWILCYLLPFSFQNPGCTSSECEIPLNVIMTTKHTHTQTHSVLAHEPDNPSVACGVDAWESPLLSSHCHNAVGKTRLSAALQLHKHRHKAGEGAGVHNTAHWPPAQHTTPHHTTQHSAQQKEPVLKKRFVVRCNRSDGATPTKAQLLI